MNEGVIRTVVADRGFGFIIPDGDRKGVFFHCSGLAPGLVFGEHLLDQRVQFEVVESEKGPRAENITLVE